MRLPPDKRSAPCSPSGGASKSTATKKLTDLGSSVAQVADRTEMQRRRRLARDLTRLADQLARYHPDAAALARAWAGDAA